MNLRAMRKALKSILELVGGAEEELGVHFVEVVVVVGAMGMGMGTSHGRGLGKTKIKVPEPTTIGREDTIRKWLVQVLHYRCKCC